MFANDCEWHFTRCIVLRLDGVQYQASTDGSKNVTERKHEQVVSELDSLMNKWLDSVPAHCGFGAVCYWLSNLSLLKVNWDRGRPCFSNEVFFGQSAFLYSHYHTLQILVHRPFIPQPTQRDPSSLPDQLLIPSLTICVNAARSASHILNDYARDALRPGWLPPLTEARYTSITMHFY